MFSQRLIIIFQLGITLAGTSISAPSSGTVAESYKVYAGGVAGVEALAAATNSTAFRADGGGLYLHNNGWGRLDAKQRRNVLEVFSNAPVAVELGFGGNTKSATAWATAWQRSYGRLGIKPSFIAANAFASNNHPTSDQWANYMDALRKAGVSTNCLILPTFEYQNFGPNRATLLQCVVSRQPVFQAIVRQAGGIVLDTPPGFFFAREQAYRDWVVDAIRWTRSQGLATVVIVSPHSSLHRFADDSLRFLKYLEDRQSVPNIFAVENYNPTAASDYPNCVGNENQTNTALGVARLLQGLSRKTNRAGHEIYPSPTSDQRHHRAVVEPTRDEEIK